MIFVGLGIGELLGKSGAILFKTKCNIRDWHGSILQPLVLFGLSSTQNVISRKSIDIPMVLIAYGLMLSNFCLDRV